MNTTNQKEIKTSLNLIVGEMKKAEDKAAYATQQCDFSGAQFTLDVLEDMFCTLGTFDDPPLGDDGLTDFERLHENWMDYICPKIEKEIENRKYYDEWISRFGHDVFSEDHFKELVNDLQPIENQIDGIINWYMDYEREQIAHEEDE